MKWIDLFDKEGNQVELESFGLIGLKLRIPSPSYETETENIEGMDGEIVLNQRLQPRSLAGEFWTKADNYEDSLAKRNDIYAYLGTGKEFYVAESHVPGKRWKVRMGAWDPKRIGSRVQEFEIPMIAKSGKCETFLIEEQRYSETEFKFLNEGSAGIDMRSQTETEIEFIGASTGLTITNATTGDVWKYNDPSVEGDVILLKGARSTKNGVSIFGQTNHKLISFAPGWNSFTIEGAGPGFALTIRTRFYFL